MSPDPSKPSTRVPSVITRPAVRTASAAGKLAASLRRLGADQDTIEKLTGQRRVRPSTH